MKTQKKVYGILQEMSGQEKVKAQDSLQEDLSLDSLSLVTLLVELEEAFGIQLDEADLNPFDLETVGDVTALVDKYLERGGESHV